MTNRKFSAAYATRKLVLFNEWMASSNVPCKHKIVIAGNHDAIIEKLGRVEVQRVLSSAIYLENSSHLVCGLRLWGSPLSQGRSKNRAFQSHEFATSTLSCDELVSRSRRDHPLDVVIMHGSNLGLLRSMQLDRQAVHIWGHAHGYHGVRKPGTVLWGEVLPCLSVNASIMDTSYRPRNLPIVVDI